MSEANAAYARQDMVALLHLQLRIAQTDTQDLLQQPAERIAAMSLLLKQQIAELENKYWNLQEDLEQNLDMEFNQTLSATSIKRHLALMERDLMESLLDMETDLQDIQADEAFLNAG